MEKQLQKELISMFKKDQESINKNSKELGKVMSQNTKRLKEIISKIGWPTSEIVWENGEHAAWLIVQHSDFDLEFQKICLNLLKKLPQTQERKIHIAYLTDRILVNRNKKQIYGTQFKKENGRLKPSPIADIDNLERRRKEIGLESFKEYRKSLLKK
ncbi:MAG: hypothetical protein Q8N63_08900 [Nanoarchaeota archaeon]|nr:hypothetical protein [Nanoarchaeota archaeon]